MMRGISFLAMLVCVSIAPNSAHAADTFPFTAQIERDNVTLRSGPGAHFYGTGHLERGREVEVYQRKPGGWLGIRPPEGSFSWVDAKKLSLTNQREVARAVGAEAVAWVGSDLGEVDDHKWQVRLDSGEAVQVLGQARLVIFGGDQEREYYQIAPPAGEFRWIHEDDVRPQAETATKVSTASEIRLADFRLVDEDESPDSGRDEFVARREPASSDDAAADETTRVASRTPADRRRSDGDSSGEFDTKHDALRLRLSAVASQTADQWNLDPLLRDAQALLDVSENTVERGKARLMLGKIQEFESLRMRYAGLSDLQAGEAENAVDEAPDTTRPATGDTFDPRFDGRGWLLPVHSSRYSSPPYALLDAEGKILSFITPAPGINLHRYVRQQVGIFGQRSQAMFLDKPHLTAERVVELNRRQSRIDLSSLLPRLGASRR